MSKVIPPIPTSIAIFSLTRGGRKLAEKLLEYHPQAEHYHRPSSFVETARKVYKDRTRCIFICSTGIVIRALAPVLRNKYQDPAVLVMDEKSQYVIPLLSGHEGGACEWGYQLAKKLSAQLVMTSATDYSRPIYSIGMGCDRGCPFSTLKELYDEAVQYFTETRFRVLASIDIKSDEAGLLELSRHLELPFIFYPASNLREVEDQLSEKSDIVFKEVGCYGVAEAAALCAASELTGQSAELVLNKKKNARATIAVARSYMA